MSARRRLPLGAELAIVVAVKLALLAVFARVFFAAPEAPHMRMEPARVAQRLLAAPAGAQRNDIYRR